MQRVMLTLGFQQRSLPDKRYTSVLPCTACVAENVASFLPLWFAAYLLCGLLHTSPAV